VVLVERVNPSLLVAKFFSLSGKVLHALTARDRENGKMSPDFLKTSKKTCKKWEPKGRLIGLFHGIQVPIL
jgi:hypothetical protein